MDILKQMLVYDPEERITAYQALRHEFFKEYFEKDQMKEFRNSLTNIRLSPNKKMQNKENQNNDIEKTFGSIDNNQNDSRFEKQSNVTVNIKKKTMISNNQKKISTINSKDQFVSIFISTTIQLNSLHQTLKIDNMLKPMKPNPNESL